jgi:hypothetical protein
MQSMCVHVTCTLMVGMGLRSISLLSLPQARPARLRGAWLGPVPFPCCPSLRDSIAWAQVWALSPLSTLFPTFHIATFYLQGDLAHAELLRLNASDPDSAGPEGRGPRGLYPLLWLLRGDMCAMRALQSTEAGKASVTFNVCRCFSPLLIHAGDSTRHLKGGGGSWGVRREG